MQDGPFDFEQLLRPVGAEAFFADGRRCTPGNAKGFTPQFTDAPAESPPHPPAERRGISI
jgi:hypothetical protein